MALYESKRTLEGAPGSLWNYLCADRSVNMHEKPVLITEAAAVIKSGGVVIVPTETFYALAVDPFQDKAVERIFRMKFRDSKKPFAADCVGQIHGGSPGACPWPVAIQLMDRFWPGSLTILLSLAVDISKGVQGPSGKIGVRVPPDCPARALASEAGGWITATTRICPAARTSENLGDSERAACRSGFRHRSRSDSGGKPSTVVEPWIQAFALSVTEQLTSAP